MQQNEFDKELERTPFVFKCRKINTSIHAFSAKKMRLIKSKNKYDFSLNAVKINTLEVKHRFIFSFNTHLKRITDHFCLGFLNYYTTEMKKNVLRN